MNEEERYLFDLQGYLVIPQILEPDTIRTMNAWIDSKAEQDPIWQGQTGNSHIDHPITWGPEFLALLDHPRVLPYLEALMGTSLRLDHDYAIFLEPGHTGLKLHGPNGAPFDPNHYYQCHNGQMFCGLTVATFALTDVLPGAGGLAVVSGSHKSNFECPLDIRLYQRPTSIVQQIPTQAGDCVIFTEALTHGTLPWKGPGVRRTLFFKYAPCQLAWSVQRYFAVETVAGMEALELQLTARQRRLLTNNSAIDHHRTPTHQIGDAR